MIKELPWVHIARQSINVAEIKGIKHNAIILGWLRDLKAWWADDETPWCGVSLAHWLKSAKLEPPKAFYRAAAYAEWGVEVKPCYGAVVVVTRVGGFHVGIAVGKDVKGNIMVLGGNQGDKVSIAAFPAARIKNYRMPSYTYEVQQLPTILSNGKMSESEA